jgi:predicted 3-demethylubiquinone-9 3-methyltransferase (glyoxalase superfamily)
VTLLPNSHVDNVWWSPAETPAGPAGMVLTVDFTVAGQQLQGLNGGPQFKFTESVSFAIDCEDQAEVNRLWEALTANGGEPGPCGWLKDRFGLSWQIVPRRLGRLVNDLTRSARRAWRRCSRWARSRLPNWSAPSTRSESAALRSTATHNDRMPSSSSVPEPTAPQASST